MDDNGRALDLLNRLMTVKAALQANMTRVGQEKGLSVAQAAVMQDLAQHPGSTLQEVCQRLGWPKSSVSRLVDDLVNRGMATRKVPEVNRRTVVLSLEESLQRHCQDGALEAFFPGAGGRLDEEEASELATALDRVLELLKNQE